MERCTDCFKVIWPWQNTRSGLDFVMHKKCADALDQSMFYTPAIIGKAIAEAIKGSDCHWCGNNTGCDCIERMTCPKAGAIGHWYCGTRSCGCPKFCHEEGDCDKNE